jgi:hypothetical protein
MGVVDGGERAQHVVVLLGLGLAAQEGGLLRERHGDALLPRLDRAGGEQEPGAVVGAHDADPAAALGFVDVRQLAGPEPVLVVIQPGEHEPAQAIDVAHAGWVTGPAPAHTSRSRPRPPRCQEYLT